MSAILAVRNGRICGICHTENKRVLLDCICEWALDHTISCMIRVPIELARKSYGATEAEVRQWLAEAA